MDAVAFEGVDTGVVSPAFVYHSTVVLVAPPETFVLKDVRFTVAFPDPGVLSQTEVL